MGGDYRTENRCHAHAMSDAGGIYCDGSPAHVDAGNLYAAILQVDMTYFKVSPEARYGSDGHEAAVNDNLNGSRRVSTTP